ncbi:Microsomal glutathione S-transferase 3 [Madurella mycetomatis]|uniref:Microsomal glutathione S-transferase 3 n=1 Tax=Madurella mycetomatis TaxID=100816 RepID=A0A175W4N1_9PEZI|nr:Microsomal glutathione S-transferase 3 [Madurella mycetomatis]
MAITLPDEYGYVLLAATSSFFLNTVHAVITSRRRKAASIPYPNSYATKEQADKDPKAFTFNCAQRAHANYTENLTPLLGQLFIAGLRYPVYAAALGTAWSAGRLLYLLGYTSARGPQGRIAGFGLAWLSDLALKGMAAWASVGYVLGWY